MNCSIEKLKELATKVTPEELLVVNKQIREMQMKANAELLGSDTTINAQQTGYKGSEPSIEQIKAEETYQEDKLGEEPPSIDVKRTYMRGDNETTDIVKTTMVQPTMDGNIEIDYITPGGTSKTVTVDGYGKGINGTKSSWDMQDLMQFKMSGPETDNEYNDQSDSAKYKTILDGEYINDTTKLNEVMDKLVEMDAVGENEAHLKYLKDFVSDITSTLNKVIPDMAIKIEENSGAIINEGKIDVKKNTGIYLSVAKDRPLLSGTKSAAEVFSHELGHSAISYALESNGIGVGDIKTRLQEFRRQAMKHITPEMLMSDVVINRQAEERQAQAIWNYINGNMEEFLVYAMTNEKVMNALKDVDMKRAKSELKGMTLFDKIVELLQRLLETITGLKKGSDINLAGDVLAMKLFKELSEANNVALKRLDEGVIGQLTTKIDDIQDKFTTWTSKGEDRAKNIAMSTKPDQTAPRWKQARWIATNWYQLLTNPELTGVLGQIMNVFGMKPEGTVQTLTRHFKDIDQYGEKWQKMMLAALQVDKFREDQTSNISNLISAGFEQKLNNEDKKALYGTVLKADIGEISDVMEISELVKVLEDDNVTETHIVALRQLIQDKSKNEREAKYYIYQAKELGEYMMTGKAKRVQHINANQISKMAGTKYQHHGDGEIEAYIDRLATLEAIRNVDETSRQRTADIIKEDEDGFKNMVKLAKAGATKRKNNVGHRYKKGYVRETLDDFKTTKIAAVKDKDKMARDGYILKEKLGKASYDVSSDEMAIYINPIHHQQNMNRSSIRFTDDRDGGTGMYEVALKSGDEFPVKTARESMKRARRELERDVEDIMDGKTSRATRDDNLARGVYDEGGRLIDMRYEIGTDFKINEMGLNMNASEATGRIWSHETDVAESEALNTIAFNEMVEDMRENYTGYNTGKNEQLYVKVSKYSKDKTVKAIYDALPNNLKDKINGMEEVDSDGNVVYRKGLHVRRDMLLDIFGVRDLSLIDAAGIRMMPRAIKTALKIVEEIWKEIVAISKIDIIIRTPAVLIGNIISNLMYSVQMGHSPVAIAKLQLEGLRAINEYTRMSAESIKLNAKIEAGVATKAEEKKLERILADMKDNAAHELIEAGLYQPIVEDANLEDMKSSSRIANWVSDKTDGSPEAVKMAANWTFITEKTWLFQAMMHATQKSDFVARYAQYNLEQERGKRRFYTKYDRRMNADEEQAMKDRLMVDIREAFINYTKPDSALVQYINDMGFAMFTKYAWRIQKVIKDGVAKRPVRFAMALLGQELIEGGTGYDPDDIAEKSILARGPSNLFYMPPIMDTLERAVVPHVYRALND